MRTSILKRSLILAALVGGAAYGWVVLDWLLDMEAGRYDSDPLEALCQAVAILAYCYLAYHFMMSRLKPITRLRHQPGVRTAEGKSQNRPIHWATKETEGSTATQWTAVNLNPVEPRKG